MNSVAAINNPKPLDYDALEQCLNIVNNYVTDEIIMMPKIGAGIARGNWGIINEMISNIFTKKEVQIWIL